MEPKGQIENLEKRLRALEEKSTPGQLENRLSLFVFSGSMDQVLAAFVIASNAAASGMQVDMFFQFWALAALRDPKKRAKKDFVSKMFGWMLPSGSRKLKLSHLHMAGMGRGMLKGVMKKKGIASIEEMIKMCADLGVKIWLCEMTCAVMGISETEIIDYPHLGKCGAAKFLENASKSRVSLFI